MRLSLTFFPLSSSNRHSEQLAARSLRIRAPSDLRAPLTAATTTAQSLGDFAESGTRVLPLQRPPSDHVDTGVVESRGDAATAAESTPTDAACSWSTSGAKDDWLQDDAETQRRYTRGGLQRVRARQGVHDAGAEDARGGCDTWTGKGLFVFFFYLFFGYYIRSLRV